MLAVGCMAAGVAWGFRTRPMPDSEDYRAAASVLLDGWDRLLERTPGYPSLLIATGSTEGSSVLLFLVQLAMHAACVLLVVGLARSCGVGRRGRVALVLLLLAPPVLLRVLLEATEALASLLLTLVAWLLLSSRGRPVVRGVALGVLCGAAALVRPTFALLFVPVAVVAALTWVRERRPSVRARAGVAACVVAPAVLLVGGYAALNAIRFDAPGLTPLAAYHLSSRTSAYVEELPERYEPARSVLVEARDRALLRGEEYAPENFIWTAVEDLERVTGLEGRELERHVMEMDLVLIVGNPFAYLDAVVTASTDYVVIDSQPQLLGVGRPVVWGLALVHWALLAVAAVLAATVPGLWVAGRLDRRSATVMAVAVVLAGYSMAVSVMVESGTARLRAPSEPLLALALVVAASCLRAAWRARRAAVAEPSGVARVT